MSSPGGIGGGANTPGSGAPSERPGDAASEQFPPGLFERITGFFRRGSQDEDTDSADLTGGDGDSGDTSDDIPVDEAGGGTLTDSAEDEPEAEPGPEPEPEDLEKGAVDLGDDDGDSEMPSLDEVMSAGRDPLGHLLDRSGEDSPLGDLPSTIPRPEPEPEPEPITIDDDRPDLPAPRFIDGGDPTFDRPDLPEPLFTSDPVPVKGDFGDPLPGGEEDESDLPSIGAVIGGSGTGDPADSLIRDGLPGDIPDIPRGDSATPEPEPEPEPVPIEDDRPDLPDPLFTGQDETGFDVAARGAFARSFDENVEGPGSQFGAGAFDQPIERIGPQFGEPDTEVNIDGTAAAGGLAPEADLQNDLGYQPTLEPVDDDEGLELDDSEPVSDSPPEDGGTVDNGGDDLPPDLID